MSDITLRQIIKEHGLLANRGRAKSLGQHFLCDMSLLRKIARAALPLDGCDVIEIGPGPGGLTVAILELAGNGRVFAIEKDRTLQPLHKQLFGTLESRPEFIYADAMKLDLQSITNVDITIIANLPYNVSSQLLVNWLLAPGRIRKMVLMFQLEVAERICATVGSRQFGRLSVLSQVVCHVEKMFDVSRDAFYPPPKVTSSVVRLTPHAKFIGATKLARLQTLLSCVFQHRRKTVFSALKGRYAVDVIEHALSTCGIDKAARPGTISPEMYVHLAEALNASPDI